MTKTRIWIVATTVLVVAVLAGGWLLLVSPKRAETDELRTQTVAAQEEARELRSQLQVLRRQEAELPAQQAKLAAIERQIPTDPMLPVLVRSLTAAARASGSTLKTISPGLPVAVATTTESATTAADQVVSPLASVPLNLELTGTYFQLEQFIASLEQLQREFLVDTFSISSDAAPDSGGALSLSVTGRVFVAASAPPAAATPGDAAASPAPGAPAGTPAPGASASPGAGASSTSVVPGGPQSPAPAPGPSSSPTTGPAGSAPTARTTP